MPASYGYFNEVVGYLMMKNILIRCLLFLSGLVLQGQEQPPPFRLPAASLEAIEDFMLQSDAAGIFDFNTLFEQLEGYLLRPLDLNRADEADLHSLGLLTDIQVFQLLLHRQQAGDLLVIYELQAIPGFDASTIKRILPFVAVNGDLDDFQMALPQMLADGKRVLYLRWNRILERQIGYLGSDQTGTNLYEGSPDQLYLRYRHSYYNRLSYGLTAEKDRGEAFFAGSNPQGFDYYSTHFFLKDYRSWLKAVAIGDFQVSFGQGLIQFSGFGYGKSTQATTIKRSGPVIRPYSSVNEALFMRGAGVELAPAPFLDIALFASSRRRDGNLITALDTQGNEQEGAAISAFNNLGLHRTPAEIADERAIRQRTLGGRVRLHRNGTHLALNLLFDELDKPLDIRDQPYNRFYFNGNRLLNTSLDYSLVYRNLNFFGETAISDQGGWATTNGLLLSLDRRVDLAVLYRNFQRDYQSLNANPLAETSGARNEVGIYLGVLLRPATNWQLSAYLDQFRFPWLRYQVAAPSGGFEYQVRLTFEQRRRLRIYLELRNESKDINAAADNRPYDYILRRSRFQMRLHIGNQVSQALELRTRVDWGFVSDEITGYSQGFTLLQDVIFRPVEFPLAFSLRYALFDTQSYAIRFYHFENNLLNTFQIPAYYNRGSRAYLNVRYRPGPRLSLEARIAQTYWPGAERIGAGLEQVQGPARTELSAQIRYRF